jgi:Cyclin, N-terminal domain
MLLGWMFRVRVALALPRRTMFLASLYLDRALSPQPHGPCVEVVPAHQLQLLGTACLVLASTMEDGSSRRPDLSAFVYYAQNSFSVAQLADAVMRLCTSSSFELCATTPDDVLSTLFDQLEEEIPLPPRSTGARLLRNIRRHSLVNGGGGGDVRS